MIRKKHKILIWFVIALLIVVVFYIFSCNTNNKMSFKSKTLTLYERKIDANGLPYLEKTCDINEESIVEDIVQICRSYDFTETESSNMGNEYFLVFNDTKEVIAFSNFDDSYGSIGKNFDSSYIGQNYKNVGVLYTPVIKISNIPLELFNILKEQRSKIN